jgi:chromodomain-helicase-DNA-binding protein 1
VEDEEDDMTPNYWGAAVEDTGPGIDRVLDHRAKADIGRCFKQICH